MKKTMFHKILEKIPAEINKLVQKQTEIAVKISQILASKEIKQKEFASQIGMKESQFSKILAGNTNLTLKTITKIEIALGEDIININVTEQKERKTTLKSDYQEVFVYDFSTEELKFHDLPKNKYQEYDGIKAVFSEPSNAQTAN
jgi:transcriptional regulator with XRE-family HTH domain